MGLYALAVVSVLVAGCGQVMLKLGARALGGFTLAALARSPFLWLGLVLYAASALIWIKVLTRMQLSVAYPLTSLSYIVVLLLSWGVLGEPLTLRKGAGFLVIAAGVALLGLR